MKGIWLMIDILRANLEGLMAYLEMSHKVCPISLRKESHLMKDGFVIDRCVRLKHLKFERRLLKGHWIIFRKLPHFPVRGYSVQNSLKNEYLKSWLNQNRPHIHSRGSEFETVERSNYYIGLLTYLAGTRTRSDVVRT